MMTSWVATARMRKRYRKRYFIDKQERELRKRRILDLKKKCYEVDVLSRPSEANVKRYVGGGVGSTDQHALRDNNFINVSSLHSWGRKLLY